MSKDEQLFLFLFGLSVVGMIITLIVTREPKKKHHS